MNISLIKYAVGLLLSLGVFCLPAEAHKVIVSAYAEGDIIEGEIGFSSGDMVADVLVSIFDDQGNKLGEVKTDDEGIFHYTPTARVPLVFKANMGQGHVAIYEMALDELPETITGDARGDAVTDASDKAQLENAVADVSQTDAPASTNGVDAAMLQSMVATAVSEELGRLKPELASAVRRETKPLRKEIAAYKEKNDLQTILGGIGYILGLFGVGFYLAARQERKKTRSATPVSTPAGVTE